MPSLAIRPAVAGDFAPIYDMVCDMEQHRLPLDDVERIFLRELNDPDHRFLVAVHDWGRVHSMHDTVHGMNPSPIMHEEPIGVLHLRMEEQLHHAARVAEIMELAVAPGHRDAGTGSQLFQAACDLARKEGCIQIEVACNQLRHDAHRFYERQGMHNFHYKFSLSLTEADGAAENALGR